MNGNIDIKPLILKALKTDKRLWDKNGEFNQILLLDLIDKTDKKIVALLFQEKRLKAKFFVKIQDAYIFKTNDFRFFMEAAKIDNSYTIYKNRIGLTAGKRFIKDTNDVALNFPFKDCILEGGQSTEEGADAYFEKDKQDKYQQKQAKRKEIFFNQVIAQDDIDRLKDDKALINWKRYSKASENSPLDAVNSPSMKGWQSERTDGVVKEAKEAIKGIVKEAVKWNELPYNAKLKKRARELRQAGNLSEVLLWNQVKNKQFLGLDFDRQKIIGNYIVDFYCKNLGIVVEIDGGSHADKEAYDKQRDDYLKSLGLKIIHITDQDIKKRLAEVLEKLREELNTPSSPMGDATPLKAGNFPLSLGGDVVFLKDGDLSEF